MCYNRYYIRTHTHFTSNGQVICYAHSPLSAFRTFLAAAVAAAAAKASPTRASAEYKLESKQKVPTCTYVCVDGRNEKDSEEYIHTHVEENSTQYGASRRWPRSFIRSVRSA